MRAMFGVAALAAALLLVAGAGAASPPQATGVSVAGAFSNPVVSGGATIPLSLCGAPGQPSCAAAGYGPPLPPVEVRWGQPASSQGRSGLGFTALAPSSIGLNQNFVVASLTHFNFEVYGSLQSVDLTVQLTAQTGDGPISFTLPFTLGIDETPNDPPCNPAYQPIVTPCPDAILLPAGGATFVSQTLNAHRYTLGVVGFTTSSGDLTHPSSLLVTQEGAATQGFLVANLSRSNSAPVAGDDTASTTSGGSTAPIDVLANDSDADGDPFSPSIATPPAHGTATVGADGTITYTADSDFAGVDHFTYTDSDGIDTSAPADVAVTVTDATRPTITAPTGTQDVEATGPDGATFTYAASANDNVDGSESVSCDPASGSTFPLGDTTVTCTSTDDAGNEASATFTVHVEDTTPPTLAGVPSAQTAEATGPNGAVVTYTPPTASDTVDLQPAVDCEPPSGSTFPLGVDTVTCTATDASGNTSAPQTFTITVRDTTPPALTVPADVTVFSANGGPATVDYQVSAQDAVDGPVQPSCTPASGSSFPVGTTLVTCTATDAAGNPATATFTVTVVANRPPVCTAVAVSPSTLWPANHKLVLVTLSGARDPDAGQTVTYRIDGVTQDEPLTGGGSGSTQYDAQRASGGSVWIRAERDGTGDGRVYTIAYTVTDPYGLSCSSTVAVTVPHDQAHAAVKTARVAVDSFGS